MRRSWCSILLFVVLAGVLGGFAAPDAAAQTAAGPEAVAAEPAPEPGEGLSWGEIVRNGGFLMYVLAALSILTGTLVIYFFVVMRVSQVAPRPLHRDLVDKIRAGAYEEARRACEFRSNPLTAVAMAAIDYVREVPQADPMLVKDVVEGEGSRQAEAIQGQTQYLLDIAAVSPMVGLLGTVFGMLRAFSSVALDVASAKPVNLAAGVSQALVTTAFGLIVGIPAMIFYAYFRRRSSKLVSSLEIASADIVTALLSKGQGHTDRSSLV